MQQDRFQIVVYSEADRAELVKQAVSDCGYPEVAVVSEQEIADFHIDVFFSPFTPAPEFIANDPSIAKYTFLHDITPLALPNIETPNQEWFGRLERSLNHRDHYFSNSEYTKKDFLRFYPVIDREKIKVTYLAVSDNFYRCTDRKKIDAVKKKYGVPANSPYVFSLCTLQPRKNLIHAVKCFVQFIEENQIDDLYFVLGGGHWEEFVEILDQEIRGLGKWKSRIIKTGYIADEDLAPLYSDAMFTVYVSLYEGFGLPVLEAMQCGCPVITSDVTSMPEVLGDTGILVDPRDPVALRKAYKQYYANAEFRSQCSMRGLERAKTFSWESAVSSMVETMDKTWKNAVNEQIVQSKKVRPVAKKKIKVGRVFGKHATPEVTTFYFAGIPLLRKLRGEQVDVVKFLGIPVLKCEHAFYEVHTKFLGITVKVRPNYPFINSQVELYTSSLANAMYQMGQRISKIQELQGVNEDRSAMFLQKELDSLEFYRLVKDAEDGKIDLRSELTAVDQLLQTVQNKEVEEAK